MPWWMTLVLVVGSINLLSIIVLATTRHSHDVGQWRRTTGVVTAILHRQTTVTTGMVHTYVVVVRTDDGETTELANPPFREIAVGDRIVRGQRVPTDDRPSGA